MNHKTKTNKKHWLILGSVLFASAAMSHPEDATQTSETTLLKCGKEGCSVVCRDPDARWDTFLHSKEQLEITYFYATGTRQFKAKDENGEYTLMDINPAYQSCRISGVKE